MEDTLNGHSQVEEETRNGNLDKQSEESYSRHRKYDRKEIYCPLTWDECCKRLTLSSLLVTLNEKLSMGDSYFWQKYCYEILLICMHIKKKEDEKAVAVLQSCSDILLSNKNENFFKEILVGLEHILFSCELFLHIEKMDNEAARGIFSRIKSFHVLNQVCQAAVLAVKAYILHLFGGKAQQEALDCITAAIELDPDEHGVRKGAWYWLAGKIHTEIRNNHGFNMMPSLEERRLLERSIQKDPFPIHYLYLADTYRQIAKMLIQQSKNNKEEAEVMSKMARKMYEDAVNDETTPLASLVRGGMGLIKLPKQLRDVELAARAFERVLKIDPDNKGALIGMGNLMNWCKNDQVEALKYFEKVSEKHPVGSSIIQLKASIDKNYNPLEDCEKYMEREKEWRLGREDSILYFHIVKAEYFLVKNKDIMEAARCWEKAVTVSSSAKEIWEYQCLFANEKRSKFSKIILEEIKLALERRIDRKDAEYLKKILQLSNSSPQDFNAGKK